jgi:hypothetical protein
LDLLIEVFGWVGALLVLVAYYLISHNKVTSEDLSFQMLNILGAVCLIIYTYSREAYASVLVNTIWVLIGLRCLVPILFRLLKKSAVIAKEATVDGAHVAVDLALKAQEVVIDTSLNIAEVAIESKEVIQEVAKDSKEIIQEVINEPKLDI